MLRNAVYGAEENRSYADGESVGKRRVAEKYRDRTHFTHANYYDQFAARWGRRLATGKLLGGDSGRLFFVSDGDVR